MNRGDSDLIMEESVNHFENNKTIVDSVTSQLAKQTQFDLN